MSNYEEVRTKYQLRVEDINKIFDSINNDMSNGNLPKIFLGEPLLNEYAARAKKIYEHRQKPNNEQAKQEASQPMIIPDSLDAKIQLQESKELVLEHGEDGTQIMLNRIPKRK